MPTWPSATASGHHHGLLVSRRRGGSGRCFASAPHQPLARPRLLVEQVISSRKRLHESKPERVIATGSFQILRGCI